MKRGETGLQECQKGPTRRRLIVIEDGGGAKKLVLAEDVRECDTHTRERANRRHFLPHPLLESQSVPPQPRQTQTGRTTTRFFGPFAFCPPPVRRASVRPSAEE